jgi:hypothetical protein
LEALPAQKGVSIMVKEVRKRLKGETLEHWAKRVDRLQAEKKKRKR